MPTPQSKPTPPATEKKRSTPQPSDETLALRALRKIRQLADQYNREAAAWGERHKELQKSRDDLVAGLSPSVAKLVAAMQEATKPAAKDEKAQ